MILRKSGSKMGNDVFEKFVLWSFVIAIISFNFEPAIDNVVFEIMSIDWIRVGVVGIIVVVLSYLSFITLRKTWRKRKEKQEEVRKIEEVLREQETKLKKLLQINFSNNSSFGIKEKLTGFKEFLKSIPEELSGKYKDKIKEFYKEGNKLLVKLRKKEEQKRLEERKRKQIFEDEINELFMFKKSKNSVSALPLDKNYCENVIREAGHRIRKWRDENKWIKQIRERAINYYSSHKLDTKPYIYNEEESIHAQVRKEIKQGKIKLEKQKVKEQEKKQLPKNFYRAKDLSEEEKEDAIRQGFKHIRGIELNGNFCGGGFYIKKDEKESGYHFYMKHLFAELNSKMLIEYGLSGKRIDVAFVDGDLRIGIEIETGTNKSEQLVAKIPWLDRNFNQWIFVCSRKNIEKYREFVDNKKSYCLTPKKAKEKVLELIKTYRENNYSNKKNRKVYKYEEYE